MEIAIAGLRDVHVREGRDSVETVTLRAGLAVMVVEDLQTVRASDDADPVVLVARQATAWIPDPDGTTIAVVSVLSPSGRDWAHVCDLALDIFDSFTWEESTNGDVPPVPQAAPR